MKIAIMGVQNSGKSTLINNLQNKFKKIICYKEKLGELINKVNDTKLVNLEFNENTDDLTQLLFAGYFINLMENNKNNKNNIEIYDRCLLDCLVYWEDLFEGDILKLKYLKYKNKTILEYIQDTLSYFDVFVFLEGGAYPLVNDNIRSINPDYFIECNNKYKVLYNFLIDNSKNIVRFFTKEQIKLNKHYKFMYQYIGN